MTNLTKGIFLSAVLLLVIAAIFQAPIAAGGGVVVLLVGLIYAYVVTKRDEARAASGEK